MPNVCTPAIMSAKHDRAYLRSVERRRHDSHENRRNSAHGPSVARGHGAFPARGPKHHLNVAPHLNVGAAPTSRWPQQRGRTPGTAGAGAWGGS